MSSSSSPSNAVMVVDDDRDVARAACLLLRRHVGTVVQLDDPSRLLPEIERQRPAVLLLDLNFQPGRTDGSEGLEVLRTLGARAEAPQVIAMTAYADVQVAVEALKLGAVDFVTKPWDNAKLAATVQAALGRLKPAPPGTATDALLGESDAMRCLRRLVATVAPTEANVLILGENGVGKERVARALHLGSSRAAGPMVTVDMGALHESTFVSELFGHRKGSYTGATADRVGRFQAADGGTLFLDEIGNLPPEGQTHLLTVLERRSVTRIGANDAEPIDVRVVSATNLGEHRLFDPAVFRPDLLYRLNTIVLRVPPLRARRDDVPLLAEHYLQHYARQYHKPARPLSAAARQALTAHDWPGNVRALRNACERATILAAGDSFRPEDFALQPPQPQPAAADDARPALAKLSQSERDAVVAAMAHADGNISQAAKLLGISRTALYRRLSKHGL